MITLTTMQKLFAYSDQANARVLTLAAGLTDRELDQEFDIGLSTLRKTLIHILSGEAVWLARWRGETETPWMDEAQLTPVSEITADLAETWRRRDQFLAGLMPEDLEREVVYRDSKAGLFSSTLYDMILQMLVHSTHHRAQASNILRRLGASIPMLDYMEWKRQPAQTAETTKE